MQSSAMNTVRIACTGAALLELDQIEIMQGNLKGLSLEGYGQLKNEIITRGFSFPYFIWRHPDGRFLSIDGTQRKKVLTRMRDEESWVVPPLPVCWIEAADEKEARLKLLAALSQYGKVDKQGLYEYLHLSAIDIDDVKVSFAIPEVNLDIDKFKAEFFKDSGSSGSGSDTDEHGSLSEKFLVPPFSVLDARQGYWKERKQKWLKFGIESEIGRDDALLGNQTREGYGGDYDTSKGESAWGGSGTSIFDPVLCEIAYRWFAPKKGVVIDPFAGGSVRGVVASKLGHQYIGVDLRGEQVEANRVQAQTICVDPQPVWHAGDSLNILDYAKGVEADLIFSCPPYADLEVYSKLPNDLSNMPYESFLEAYRKIIANTCQLLRDNRFAVFVVGEVRDEKGLYRNFVGHTIQAFVDAGLRLYNEAVLITPTGSLPIRAGRIFTTARKLSKGHQNFLVFVKGDPRTATEACGEVEIPAELYDSVDGAVGASE